MGNGGEAFVTLPEAAHQLGLSIEAMRRRVRRGDLPSYRHPIDRRFYLFRREDLEAYRQPMKVNRPHLGATTVEKTD